MHAMLCTSVEQKKKKPNNKNKRTTPRPGRAGSLAHSHDAGRQTSNPRKWELQRTLLATIWVRDLRAKFEVDQDVSRGERDLGIRKRLGLPRGKCWFAYYGLGGERGSLFWFAWARPATYDWTLKIGPVPDPGG